MYKYNKTGCAFCCTLRLHTRWIGHRTSWTWIWTRRCEKDGFCVPYTCRMLGVWHVMNTWWCDSNYDLSSFINTYYFTNILRSRKHLLSILYCAVHISSNISENADYRSHITHHISLHMTCSVYLYLVSARSLPKSNMLLHEKATVQFWNLSQCCPSELAWMRKAKSGYPHIGAPPLVVS